MHPRVVDGTANSDEPDYTAPLVCQAADGTRFALFARTCLIITWINFMLSLVEHEKVYNLGARSLDDFLHHFSFSLLVNCLKGLNDCNLMT